MPTRAISKVLKFKLIHSPIAGRTLIYLISDDNFSPPQRTLFLMFELAE